MELSPVGENVTRGNGVNWPQTAKPGQLRQERKEALKPDQFEKHD